MRAIVLALTLAASAAPALAAPAMTVTNFLARADRLVPLGPAAALHPDFQPLRQEIRVATQSYRAEVTAQHRAGKPMHSCPPADLKIGPYEMLDEFRAIPRAQARRMTVKQGFYSIMKRRYPCPTNRARQS